MSDIEFTMITTAILLYASASSTGKSIQRNL